MPDFECKVKACKVSWIKRFCQNSKCAVFAKEIGLPLPLNEMLFVKYDMKYMPDYVSPFYKQILEYWFELYAVEPTSIKEVRSELLFLNRYITVDNQPIFDKQMYNAGLKYINDIVDNEGNFESLNYVNTRFNIHLDIMRYNSIKDAIPRSWRNMIRGTHKTEPETDLLINVFNVRKSILFVSTKDLYWICIDKIAQDPTVITKWEQRFPRANFDWQEIFLNPYKVARETDLQSLQFQILHRFYPCNYILNKWYRDQPSFCETCNVQDDLDHYFFTCRITDTFWQHFNLWWSRTTGIVLNIGIFEVLLGLQNPFSDKMIDSLNYCILLAKKFISVQKKGNSDCQFHKFKLELKQRLDTEHFIYMQNGKENDYVVRWSTIHQTL